MLSLLMLIFLSGCSSYETFKSDCMGNEQIRLEVLNHTWLWVHPENEPDTFEEDYEKLEAHCLAKFGGVN